jgi:hypothetical protein
MQKIADMLATMRRSLKLVGNVPEFGGGMEKLQVSALTVLLIITALILCQKVVIWMNSTSSSVGLPATMHRLDNGTMDNSMIAHRFDTQDCTQSDCFSALKFCC